MTSRSTKTKPGTRNGVAMLILTLAVIVAVASVAWMFTRNVDSELRADLSLPSTPTLPSPSQMPDPQPTPLPLPSPR